MAHSGLFVAPVAGTPPVGMSPTDGRLALGGIFGVAGQVVSGGGLTPSPTTMQIVVGQAVWQLPDPTNAAATFFSPTDATALTLAAAPASGGRIDLIVVKQNNVENGDADSRANVTLITGVASGSPTPPSLPAGYWEYAQVLVSAGNANAAATTITILSPSTFAPPRLLCATYAQLQTISGQLNQTAYVSADSNPANNGEYRCAGGTTWLASTVGMKLIAPSSVVVGSGSYTVSPLGAITYTAVSKITVEGVFGASFQNYLLVVNNTAKSAASNVALQMALAGVADTAAANYEAVRGYDTGSARTVATVAAGTLGAIELEAGTQGKTYIEAILHGPALASAMQVRSAASSFPYSTQLSGVHTPSVAYDGFALSPNASGTMTGELWVYGFNQG
jgi:hypothetical protein